VVQLSGKTEEGLWLWEVLNELESSELTSERDDVTADRRSRCDDDNDEEEGHSQKLSYDEFIKGRRLRADDLGIARNALAGSELTHVRSYLNRILTVGDYTLPPAEDETITRNALDLGDEVANPASALERGDEFGSLHLTEARHLVNETQPDGAVRLRANRKEVAQAVRRFNVRLKERTASNFVSPVDVLKLRAMLMIIAAAGQPLNITSKLTSLQVLPLDNSGSGWPRLMGQLLFAFFGGNAPAISRLQVDQMHDQLPDDILEGWSTAMWAIQACVCAASEHKAMRRTVLGTLGTLAAQIYVRIGMASSELRDRSTGTVFAKLNDRFAARLMLSPIEIDRSHQTQIKQIIQNKPDGTSPTTAPPISARRI
jgi:hypothetical protein